MAGVNNVMGKTIHEVQQAIENIQKDDEDDHDSLGIASGTRAKLAEQAKRTNEQREKQRISAGVAGLEYSDESEDEAEDHSPSRGLPKTNGVIPTQAATAIPLPTSPPPFSPGGGPRISPAPAPGLAERLEPALSLPNTPPLDRNVTIPAKPPLSWNVDDVVTWAVAKGFDDSICQKFRGESLLVIAYGSCVTKLIWKNTRSPETCCWNWMPTCSKSSTSRRLANDSVSLRPSLSYAGLAQTRHPSISYPHAQPMRLHRTHSEECPPLPAP